VTDSKRSLIPKFNGETFRVIGALVVAVFAGLLGWYGAFQVLGDRVSRLTDDMAQHERAAGHSPTREDLREVQVRILALSDQMTRLSASQEAAFGTLKEDIQQIRDRLGRRSR
jgi:hypothetical protein